jgi:hypothetical protein
MRRENNLGYAYEAVMEDETSPAYVMPIPGATIAAVEIVAGGVGVDEVQTVTLTGAVAGTWRLAYEGEWTSYLDASASDTEVSQALRALEQIDTVDGVEVESVWDGLALSHTITFGADLSETNVATLQVDGTRLDGDVLAALNAQGLHLPPDLSDYEVIRGPLL